MSSWLLLPLALLLASWPTSTNYRPDPARRWFKGNTHAHTTRSDGDSAPDVVARWYADHGYDFLVLSDHNVLVPVEEGGRPRDGFLLVPGEEVTAWYRASEAVPKVPVHVNALNVARLVEPFHGTTARETLTENVRRVREAGAVPHVNHPNFHWALTHQDLLGTPGYRLVEIFNGHPTVHNHGGSGRPSMEEVWDRLLTAGRAVYGIAVDDAHHFQGEFGPDRVNPGRGWVVVRAREATASALVEALEAGDFYASTGVVLRDVVAGPKALVVKVAADRDFGYTTTFIGRRGKVLATVPGPEARYAIRGKEGYVRARVVDSGGRVAWVQPVFVR